VTHPRLFVSFAGGDNEFVRQLISRLKSPAHDLDVWLYENEGDEITWGDDIIRRLEDELRRCDVFVPIISEHAFRSTYTCLEVRKAIEFKFGKHSKRILPIASEQLRETSTEDWDKDYSALHQSRVRFVDFTSLSSLEAAVFDICAELEVDYNPLLLDDPRLPVMSRFTAELHALFPKRAEHSIGIYRRLMLVFCEFEQAFLADQFDSAENLMAYMCMMCEYEFPNIEMYYPHLVRAICMLQMEKQKLDEALVIFMRLQSHPKFDESVLGGLGCIYQSQGDYSRALECYKAAAKLKPDDPAARTGVLVNRMMSGERVDLDAEFAWLDKSIDDNPDQVGPNERQQLLALKVFAYSNALRPREASQAFTQLERLDGVEAHTAIHFSNMLANLGEVDRAVKLLEIQSRNNPVPDAELFFHQSHLLSQLQSRKSMRLAIAAAENAVRLQPESRKYLQQLMSLLWMNNDLKQASQMARMVLDVKQFPHPVSDDDYYSNGFAQWILGNKERANYDFERSGYPAENHYQYISRGD
jgi:tetratricopeptide (TPR) repeat protein